MSEFNPYPTSPDDQAQSLQELLQQAFTPETPQMAPVPNKAGLLQKILAGLSDAASAYGTGRYVPMSLNRILEQEKQRQSAQVFNANAANRSKSDAARDKARYGLGKLDADARETAAEKRLILREKAQADRADTSAAAIAERQLQDDARGLGINTSGKSSDQVRAEMAAAHKQRWDLERKKLQADIDHVRREGVTDENGKQDKALPKALNIAKMFRDGLPERPPDPMKGDPGHKAIDSFVKRVQNGEDPEMIREQFEEELDSVEPPLSKAGRNAARSYYNLKVMEAWKRAQPAQDVPQAEAPGTPIPDAPAYPGMTERFLAPQD